MVEMEGSPSSCVKKRTFIPRFYVDIDDYVVLCATSSKTPLFRTKITPGTKMTEGRWSLAIDANRAITIEHNGVNKLIFAEYDKFTVYPLIFSKQQPHVVTRNGLAAVAIVAAAFVAAVSIGCMSLQKQMNKAQVEITILDANLHRQDRTINTLRAQLADLLKQQANQQTTITLLQTNLAALHHHHGTLTDRVNNARVPLPPSMQTIEAGQKVYLELKPGDVLKKGDKLCDNTGDCLAFDNECNLVSAVTGYKCIMPNSYSDNCSLHFQHDRNLVVYDKQNKAVYSSGTDNNMSCNKVTLEANRIKIHCNGRSPVF